MISGNFDTKQCLSSNLLKPAILKQESARIQMVVAAKGY